MKHDIISFHHTLKIYQKTSTTKVLSDLFSQSSSILDPCTSKSLFGMTTCVISGALRLRRLFMRRISKKIRCFKPFHWKTFNKTSEDSLEIKNFKNNEVIFTVNLSFFCRYWKPINSCNLITFYKKNYLIMRILISISVWAITIYKDEKHNNLVIHWWFLDLLKAVLSPRGSLSSALTRVIRLIGFKKLKP